MDFCSNLSSLDSLTVMYDSISGLKPLEDLSELTYLNLIHNCIYDTSTYTGDDGNTVTYKNLQILADLYNGTNNNGKLRKLYLSGNKGITDYSLISNLNWSAKDF